MQNVNINLRETQRQARRTENSLRTTFSHSLSFVRQLGSSLQVVGKTLTQLSSPFRSLFRGTILGAGYKLFNNFTSGLQDAADRFDTIRTFAPIIKSMGAGLSSDDAKATEQLQESYDKMYKSILGLPTGMGEMVDRFKLLTIATQDYAKATELTIAENNALIASATSESTATMAKKQLQTFMTTGKLTERQFLSLQKGIPVAWNMIEKEMKETGRINGSLIEALKGGKISAEEFADALIKVSNSDAMQKILHEVMHTFGSATQNVQNFARAMGKDVIETVNEILKKAFGKDLIDYINGLSDVIQRLDKAVTGWIKANPQLITDFVETLTSLDWGGFLRGLGDGLKQTIEDVEKFLKLFGGKDAYAFGRFMGRAGYWGRIFSFMGAMLKGFRFPIAGLMTLFARLGQGTLGGGLFGGIADLLMGRDPLQARRRLENLPTVTQSFQSLVQSLTSMLKFAGGIAIATGTGVIAFKGVKTILKDLKETIEIINSIDDWDTAASVVEGLVAFLGGFATFAAIWAEISGTLSGTILASELVIGAITTLALGIVELNVKQTLNALTDFKKILQTIDESIEVANNIRSANLNQQNVETAIETLSTVYELLRPQYQGEGIQNMSAGQAKKMGEILSNMKGVLEKLRDSVTVINELGTIPDVTAAKKNIELLVGTISDVFEIFKGAGMVAGEKPQQSENVAKITENIVGLLTTLNNSVDIINELGKKKLNIENINGIITRIATIRNQLYREFKYGNMGFNFQAQDTGYIKQMIDDISSMMNSINQMVTLFADEENGFGRLTYDQFSLDFARVELIFKRIAEWWTDFWTDFGGGIALQGAGDFKKDLNDMVQAMGQITTLVKTLDSIKEVLSGREINVINTISQITPFISELNGVAGAIDGLQALKASTNVGAMKNALEGIKELVDIAKSLDGGDASIEGANSILGGIASAMEGMSEQITAIASTWNTAIQNGFDFDGLNEYVVTGLNGLLKTFDSYKNKFYSKGLMLGLKFKDGIVRNVSTINVSSTVNINAHLGSLSTGSLISSAINAIENALDGLTVNPNINVNTNDGFYNGGVVYRAHGGSIFKPRGRDTIPAMLSQGEFVQRKKAVDTFGLDFMNRVNRLDIAGAMQALQSRVNSRIGGRSSSTVNNVVNNNNNQRVTMNVNTNNPNFAFKRTNRYVGAI